MKCLEDTIQLLTIYVINVIREVRKSHRNSEEEEIRSDFLKEVTFKLVVKR